MYKKTVLILTLCGISFSTPVLADRIDTDAVIGGALGGAAGAAVGSAIGGREGAIIGSGVGAAAGTAIATHGGKNGKEGKGSGKPKVYEQQGGYQAVYEPVRYRRHRKIPPGHMPPPGQCRVWYPNRPAGHQPPPGNCQALQYHTPPGAWLVRR